MKRSIPKMTLIWIFVIFTSLLACNRRMENSMVKKTSSPESVTKAPVPLKPSSAIPAPSGKVEAIPSTPTTAQVPKAMSTPKTLKLEDAYFDFDKSLIRADARGELDEDARLLKRNTGVTIEIEGHCDERGTAEYNLALGDRRALAAKRYLVSLGVNPLRITTISYGKENPFCDEHSEACYQENRRDHFVLFSLP